MLDNFRDVPEGRSGGIAGIVDATMNMRTALLPECYTAVCVGLSVAVRPRNIGMCTPRGPLTTAVNGVGLLERSFHEIAAAHIGTPMMPPLVQ